MSVLKGINRVNLVIWGHLPIMSLSVMGCSVTTEQNASNDIVGAVKAGEEPGEVLVRSFIKIMAPATMWIQN